MAENLIPESVSRHVARNEKLVERIVELGGELDESRTIDFFFYVSDEQDGELLAADLRNLAFQNVRVSPSKDQWAVVGEYQGSVSEITDVAFIERLASLAAKYLGEFDGWGTAV
jgi:hypothetical protein